MIIPLSEPIRGATHVDMHQVVFDLRNRVIIARGELGAEVVTDGVPVFVRDAELAERCCFIEGDEYDATYMAVDATPVVALLDSRRWAPRAPVPSPEPETTE